MKKAFVIFAAAAVLASCAKEASVVTKSTPMTLTATLAADPETKVTYTDDSGLKASWEATETMSVISINGSSEATHIDNFTSTGAAGRATAEFTGSITEDPTTTRYICVYPAVTSSSPFRISSLPTQYAHWSVNNTQVADGDLSHIKNYAILSGEPTINGSNLSVEMQNRLSVLKFVVTFPDAAIGRELNNLTMDASAVFGSSGSLDNWTYVYESSLNYGGSGGSTRLMINTYSPSGYIQVPSSKVLTIYGLFRPGSVHENDTWTIKAIASNSDILGTKTLTWSADKTLETGKLYTITTTLE
ncbi:MAG: hypothetical protein MJY94_04800 [Bacteroidales bacterium]|nr:hypothetical protein [Bacteroidales bacterium]